MLTKEEFTIAKHRSRDILSLSFTHLKHVENMQKRKRIQLVLMRIYMQTNNTCNIDNMQIRQKGYSALHCTAVDVVDVTCRGRLLYISISAISYQQCNLHAEEDGECIAYQPGDAKPKQGQPLLPTAKAFNEIQCMTSYGSVSAGRERSVFP